MPLDKVRNFLKKKGHLVNYPKMPSKYEPPSPLPFEIKGRIKEGFDSR